MDTFIRYTLLMAPVVVWYFACLDLIFFDSPFQVDLQLLALLIIVVLWMVKVAFPVMLFLEEHTS